MTGWFVSSKRLLDIYFVCEDGSKGEKLASRNDQGAFSFLLQEQLKATLDFELGAMRLTFLMNGVLEQRDMPLTDIDTATGSG